ncbi:hypothetical protein Scep_016254 [Stephania cephalantha]|uniref:Uncharacterized protein n=1 Tax=Stephania cephalantha TaxID=152367 RepID=A0AAP0IMC1_9MAGN
MESSDEDHLGAKMKKDVRRANRTGVTIEVLDYYQHFPFRNLEVPDCCFHI